VDLQGVEDAVVGADEDFSVADGGGGDGGGIRREIFRGGFSSEFDVPDDLAFLRVDAAEVIVPSADEEARAVGGGLGLEHVPARHGPHDGAGGGVEAVNLRVGGADADDALRDRRPGEDRAAGWRLPLRLAAARVDTVDVVVGTAEVGASGVHARGGEDRAVHVDAEFLVPVDGFQADERVGHRRDIQQVLAAHQARLDLAADVGLPRGRDRAGDFYGERLLESVFFGEGGLHGDDVLAGDKLRRRNLRHAGERLHLFGVDAEFQSRLRRGGGADLDVITLERRPGRPLRRRAFVQRYRHEWLDHRLDFLRHQPIVLEELAFFLRRRELSLGDLQLVGADFDD